MVFWRKYNTPTHVYVPMIKRGVVDFAVSGDWTPAAGDVKISKDGGAAANVTNLPTAITMGNTAMWDFSLVAAELSAAKVVVMVADSATKAVEDQCFIIETYGHASAELKMDWSDSVRMGLTALPNAAAEAAGGLYTRGSGAGQINQPANGQIDVNTVKVGGTVQTARDLGASVLLSPGTGAGQISLSSGQVTVSANNDKAGYSLGATGLDSVVTAEPASPPAFGGTIKGAISWLLALARNKITETSTTQTLRNDADSATIATSAQSDDGTTYTRGKWS